MLSLHSYKRSWKYRHVASGMGGGGCFSKQTFFLSRFRISFPSHYKKSTTCTCLMKDIFVENRYHHQLHVQYYRNKTTCQSLYLSLFSPILYLKKNRPYKISNFVTPFLHLFQCNKLFNQSLPIPNCFKLRPQTKKCLKNLLTNCL